MDEDDEYKALRQVLEARCPGAKFEDGDIKKLVDAGFVTETALAVATKDSLDIILSTQPDVVDVLVKAFVQPTGAEKGPTSEALLATLINIGNDVKCLAGLIRESLPGTRGALSIRSDDMSILRRCLGVVVISEEVEGGITLKALLGDEMED